MSGFPTISLTADLPALGLPLLVKSTLILTLACLTAFCLRRASASARHMVWALALYSLVALPFLSIALPRWKVPILPPAPSTPAAVTSALPGLSPADPPRSSRYLDGPRDPFDSAPIQDRREGATWAPPPVSVTAPPARRASPAAPATPVRESATWPRWAIAVWSTGAALGLLQFLTGTLVVWRAARRAQLVTDGSWPDLLAQASVQLGVRRAVQIRTTAAVSAPVVWGWRRPVILVPHAAKDWPRDQRLAFLRHELAHVARHDCLSQVAATLAQSLYWPHPLVFWAVRRLRAEAERACDDRVVTAGTDAPEYARYLLDAARGLRGGAWIPSSSSAVVERTHLGDRLLALLDDGRNRRAVGRRAVATVGGLVLVVAAALAALQPAARAAAVKAVRAVVAPVLGEQAVDREKTKTPAKPTPKTESALTGTVKGPDGKPVEAALVIAKPSREWIQPMTATTDADGRFRVPLPPRAVGPWDLTVDAKGLATATLERVTAGVPLAVALKKGGVVRGTVRDGNDGRPLEGVRVVATMPSTGGLRYSLPWLPFAGVKDAETDKEGRYRIAGLTRGRFTVTASKRAYGLGQQHNVTPGASVDLLLFPGATLSGSVRGPDERPVAGATVVVQRRTSSGWTWGWAEVTDAQGRFVVAAAEPGSYLLMTRHPQWAPSLVEAAVEALAETRVDIPLQAGAPVLGRLADDQDRPVAGKVVMQEVSGLTVPRQLAESLKVETGPDGVFVLERMPVGAHTFGITAPGFASRRLEVEVPPRQRSVDLGKVTLERGLTISGRVTDRTGVPIANASLYASPTTSATFAFYTSSPDPVRSEADGSFVIGGLETGIYGVTASAPGYVTAGQRTDAGSDKPVRLVLAPGGAISGSVVDSQRRPVESFNVSAERTEQGGNGYGASGAKDVTAPDGRFLLEDLAEGTYVVHVRAPEAMPGTATGVRVVAGRTADAGAIRLGAGGIVRGSVVDAAGTPVAGATLAAFATGVPWRDRAEGQSDANGLFEIRGVPAGRVDVTAAHPSYAEGRVSGLDVDPTRGPTEAKVVLSVGGRVQGSVRKRDGTPVTGVSVGVALRRSGEEPPRSLDAAVSSDGTFAIDKVPPGPSTVTIWDHPSPGVSMPGQSKDVVVVEGQTLSVDFVSREMLVVGRVTRGEVALPGVRVTVRTMPFSMSMSWEGAGIPTPKTGPQPLTGVTRDDGGYELLLHRPGPGWVEVASLDGKVQYASRNVEVPDVETYTLDLKVGGAPVTGAVVDKETGKGIPRANVRAASRGDDGGGATAGPDGRFAFELPSGDYKLSASADDYASSESQITVGESGASELRLELSRGLALEGKVVDLAGRPVSRVSLVARYGDPAEWAGFAASKDDGSFRFEHLTPRAYVLTGLAPAGSGFAVRSGVTPGDKDVLVTLRPGGRIRLTVLGDKGAPVSDAVPSVATLDGVRVGFVQNTGRTDGAGVVDFPSPAGVVEIKVSKGKESGKATVEVEVGATASARIILGPAGS